MLLNYQVKLLLLVKINITLLCASTNFGACLGTLKTLLDLPQHSSLCKIIARQYDGCRCSIQSFMNLKRETQGEFDIYTYQMK
jgi:hypothetical protein